MNDVILSIRSLLQSKLGNTYKKYYYGDIKVLNQRFLPFIEVIPVTSNITNRGTGGMLDNNFSVQINIKNTLKNYLKENTDVEILDHIQDLVNKMEERESDGNFKSNTIMGVLHDNLQLSNTANINNDWVITYDEIDLKDGSYITFASVNFSVKRISC